jgi:hypothetical protein
MKYIEEFYILGYKDNGPLIISTDVSKLTNSSETSLHFQWTRQYYIFITMAVGTSNTNLKYNT